MRSLSSPASAVVKRQRADLLIHPIGELVTPYVESGPARLDMLQCVKRIKNGAIAASGEEIISVGSADEVLGSIELDEGTVRIDAGGKLVTPGLVDSHTHLIFGGNRANEFIMRCQGKTYQEIAQAGGGIVASMKATRLATVEELKARGAARLKRMLESGTTTCEVKTGYGLDLESELRMLQTIYDLQDVQAVELVPTFMAAHAFPPEHSHEGYVEHVIMDMLPRVQQMAMQNAEMRFKGYDATAPFVDVFCDEGYFSLDASRRILNAGMSLGMKTKIHSDEFANLGGTSLAVQIGSTSADHLLNISDKEIELMAGSDVVAVLLPGTSFYLNLKDHAPARKMIEAGVAVALGSDFNPGSCHISSLPMIWALACLHLKMTPEEALSALTINSAFAINRGDKLGQLRVGYQADMAIYDVATLEEVPYNLGWNPVIATIKKGRIAHRKNVD